MQTNVPQFIDVEDKVIGPFTLKQAGYIIGAGIIIYIFYYFFEFGFFIFLSLPIAALAAALAFYRPGERSFISQLKNQAGYLFSPKQYLWKRLPAQDFKAAQEKSRKTNNKKKGLQKSEIKNLKELASILDRGGKR